MLFSISCNNAYAPFGYDIPTTSGDPGYVYFFIYLSGNFTRAKLEVNPETKKNIAETEVIFPSTSNRPSAVSMYKKEISVEASETTIKDAPYYRYGDYYDTGLVYNARVDNGNVKSYIKFNMDTKNAEYIVAMTTNGMSIRATYTAILEDNSPTP